MPPKKQYSKSLVIPLEPGVVDRLSRMAKNSGMTKTAYARYLLGRSLSNEEREYNKAAAELKLKGGK